LEIEAEVTFETSTVFCQTARRQNILAGKR